MRTNPHRFSIYNKNNHPFNLAIIFNFALRSIVLDFIIFLINQITYKYKLIPLVFQTLKNARQCFGGVFGIVVKKHNRAVFNLACDLFANTFRRGVIFPVKGINIRNKSNI